MIYKYEFVALCQSQYSDHSKMLKEYLIGKINQYGVAIIGNQINLTSGPKVDALVHLVRENGETGFDIFDIYQ